MPIANPQLAREQQIAQYAQEIDTAYPPGPDSAGNVVDFGADYIKYMDAHSQANPTLIYQTLMARLAIFEGVPLTIAKAVGAGAGATGALVKSGAQATSSLYPAWLQSFLGANGVIRIAEGVLGIVLVAVALDKMLGGNAPAIATKIAKVVK